MSSFPLPKQPSPTAPYEELIEWLAALLTTAIIVTVLSALVTWIVTTPTTGIVTKCASDQIEKGTSSLSASINFTISKLPSLLMAQFIIGILTVIGLFLLFIPGIIISIMFFLTIPTIIVEPKGAFESLGRSRRLVSNRWLKTFALLLIVGTILGTVIGIVNLLTLPLNTTYPNISFLIINIAFSFVAPVSPIAITYLYYAMVAREIPPPPPPPF